MPAKEKKYELIAKDNRASFEMDCMHNLISDRDKGYCIMEYKSVIGNGRIEIVADEEKYNALRIITDHYHTKEFEFNQNAVPHTTVLKLTVELITGESENKKAKEVILNGITSYLYVRNNAARIIKRTQSSSLRSLKIIKKTSANTRSSS